MITDEKCADPYFISKHEYSIYKLDYDNIPGTVVQVLKSGLMELDK
jgi:hypothetical protein